MTKQKSLKGHLRSVLLEELHQRYAYDRSFSHRLTYLRKKYTWIFVVEGSKVLKRLIDIVLSLALLIILSPLLAIIGVLIKFIDGGSVLYAAPRVGKWGKEFICLKFRSMKVDADVWQKSLAECSGQIEGKRFKMKNDPRVTWIGKILRKTSLDELPQLWNVLKGDMSLVGPRPPLPSEVANYTLGERKRLEVVPGLTCFWQVGGRSEIPFAKQVELDLRYIESQNFWLDLFLLLKTIPAVMFGRGAY